MLGLRCRTIQRQTVIAISSPKEGHTTPKRVESRSSPGHAQSPHSGPPYSAKPRATQLPELSLVQPLAAFLEPVEESRSTAPCESSYFLQLSVFPDEYVR